MTEMLNSSISRLKYRYIVSGFFIIILFYTTIKLFGPFSEIVRQNQENSDIDYSGNGVVKKTINLNELFYVGECLLRQSGDKIVEIRNDQIFSNVKKDKSIVTKADLQSHNIIVHSLEHTFKNLKVISEENPDTDDAFNANDYLTKCGNYAKQPNDVYANLKDVNVWIDPLDATQEYSENLTDYVTVMFCITVNQKPKAGIIYKPFKKTLVKSFFENKPTKSFQETGKPRRIIVSRSHTGTVKTIIEEKFKDKADIIIAGGSGYKTTALLEDNADLYLHSSNIFKWDICAPNAILNNLGGKLLERNGKEVIYSDDEPKAVDGIIAALTDFDFYLNIFKKS